MVVAAVPVRFGSLAFVCPKLPFLLWEAAVHLRSSTTRYALAHSTQRCPKHGPHLQVRGFNDVPAV